MTTFIYRNPSENDFGVWCYTTDEDKRCMLNSHNNVVLPKSANFKSFSKVSIFQKAQPKSAYFKSFAKISIFLKLFQNQHILKALQKSAYLPDGSTVQCHGVKMPLI